MPMTKADMAQRVLTDIKVLASGETPSVDDQALVMAAIDAIHAELKDDRLVGWDFPDVPVKAARPFAEIVAASVAGAFGINEAESQSIMVKANAAEIKFHQQRGNEDTMRQRTEGTERDPVEAEYY